MKPLGRIWVLPNRNTFGIGAVLLAMWYAGASQNNGAAYLLCFVLAAITIVSLLHARANLRGLRAAADAIRPVFAGGELVIPVRVEGSSTRGRSAIRARTYASAVPVGDMHGSGTAELRSPATKRGFFRGLPVRFESDYPLGFFTAHGTAFLEQPHFVYPAACGGRPLPYSLAPARHARDGLRSDGDDYRGVRAWMPGESQRHIDWKAAARGQPLLTKQWGGDADETLQLDWSMLDGLGEETRLSQLAEWVVLAEGVGAIYSLSVPGATVAPGRGEAHYHSCLRTLAGWRAPEESRRAS